MQRFVVNDKVIPFPDMCAALIPVVNSATFQDIRQFQIVVSVGLAFCGWTDEYIELVFVQIVSVIYRKYPPKIDVFYPYFYYII